MDDKLEVQRPAGRQGSKGSRCLRGSTDFKASYTLVQSKLFKPLCGSEPGFSDFLNDDISPNEFVVSSPYTINSPMIFHT